MAGGPQVRLLEADWRRRRLTGVALGVALPLVITGLLDHAGEPGAFRPSGWYLFAIVTASLVGGLWALGVATVTSSVGLWWAVSTPRHSFSFEGATQAWGTLGFTLVAGAVGLLVIRLESALRQRDDAVAARLEVEAEARAREQVDQARAKLLESEVQRARDRRNVDAMQDAMVPHDLPEVAGYELEASFTPASEDLAIGGDWYDAFRIDDATLGFAVGDVSGHGVEGVALMAQLRNALRAYAFEDATPGRTVQRLNQLLCRLEADHFATVLFGSLRLEDGCCRWSSAGHPNPVLFGPDGAWMTDRAAHGPLLGFRTDAAYGESTHVLRPGEGMLVFSDGLVERRGENIDEGITRLVASVGVLAGGPQPATVAALVSEAGRERDGRDDACQLIVRRTDPVG